MQLLCIPNKCSAYGRHSYLFRTAYELQLISDALKTKQINTLIYSMGNIAEDILWSLWPNAEEKESYTAVRDKFDSFHWKVKYIFQMVYV